MKYFYSHLIEIESVLVKLDEMELTGEQKIHLAALIDSTIHQTILDIVFSQLSESDRLVLIEKLKADSEAVEVMDFLSSKIDNIEDQIFKVVAGLKEELHEDIKEARRFKKGGR